MTSYQALKIKLSRKLSGEFFGSFMTAFTGQWSEFSHLREYVYADSVRKIDWKTTAKHNKTFIKNYQQQRDISALFIIDSSQSLLFGSKTQTKLDTLKEVFYILASAATYNDFKVTSMVWDQLFSQSNGEISIIQTLNSLDKISKDIQHSSHPIPDALYPRIKNKLIFVLSDKIPSKQLGMLAQNNDLVYIHIFDELEQHGSQEIFRINIWSIASIFSKKNNTHYTKRQQQDTEDLTQALKQKRIRYLSINESDNICSVLHNFFIKTVSWNI